MVHKFYPRTVDSHMHLLEMQKKGMEIDELLSQLVDQGLISAMDVAVDEKNFEERLSYLTKHPQLLFSAGVHPTSTKEITKQISILDKQVADDRISAVGETGLDFHWDTVPAHKQKEMFAAHIALANKYKKPLIVHNRLADKEILELLISEKAESGIIHCFSSDHHFAKKFLDLGFYISFAGNITYKKAENIRQAASVVPLDRLLVETDAPYLSPQGKRGKLNHPGHISYIIDCIADIFNKGADETAQQIYLNYNKIYNAQEN